MNTNDYLELSHPVAMLLLGIAFGLLIVIIMLAYTIFSATDVYRDRYLKNMLLATPFIPGMPDSALFVMMSVIVTEIIVILVLLHVLRTLTGLRVNNKAWALSFIVMGLAGYLWAFQFTHSTTAQAAPVAAVKETIDENNVPVLSDEASVKAGRLTFVSKCAMCHGPQGKGAVGPDLTDATWLHGGTTKEIFHTIWNGVPEKGMRAWKGALSGKQVAETIAYIHSIQGS
ncbi:c-type cytochrome [Chitinophaga sp. GCM10012297]|uniref:C-type cytochrome n=1 Tax=Chitinophaga chungangae TaxID=2821488 RepID=A0ABS3YK52_9BACT|nr:c-type cytochrome [Chitinophaga chungangae]MBO9155072.1 c-type cytochrome [Chitinophaga chungangae]